MFPFFYRDERIEKTYQAIKTSPLSAINGTRVRGMREMRLDPVTGLLGLLAYNEFVFNAFHYNAVFYINKATFETA